MKHTVGQCSIELSNNNILPPINEVLAMVLVLAFIAFEIVYAIVGGA